MPAIAPSANVVGLKVFNRIDRAARPCYVVLLYPRMTARRAAEQAASAAVGLRILVIAVATDRHDANAGRDLPEELVARRDADRVEHRLPVVVGETEVWMAQVVRSSRRQSRRLRSLVSSVERALTVRPESACTPRR